ncbi:MAG: KH domain-containing protein [Chlamydiales bacterium]|nr:KH domain-containing protein [Chlamydiales bacterium]
MEEFIAYMIRNLVDTPDDVKIDIFDGSKSSVIEIRVNSDDVAKLVGRQGRTIKALRQISMTVAARLGRKVRLEIVQ